MDYGVYIGHYIYMQCVWTLKAENVWKLYLTCKQGSHISQ